MTLVAITQRILLDPATGERRDALDQRWHAFLREAGLVALPVPNDATATAALVRAVEPAGAILSGGGDLAAYGGDAADRDAAEAALLSWATERRKPVLGVCRGLQQLVHSGGGRLERIEGHVRARHRLSFLGRDVLVNSYHDFAVATLPEGAFEVLARAEDGAIEAVRHRGLPQLGIMWHPERETPFAAHDLALFHSHFAAPAALAACAG